MDVVKRVAEVLSDEMGKLYKDASRKAEILSEAVAWFEQHRPEWGPGTLPTWYVDAKEHLEHSKRKDEKE